MFFAFCENFRLFLFVLRFDVLVNHGADECVESFVLFAFVSMWVYGGLRVWAFDLLLEAGFVDS